MKELKAGKKAKVTAVNLVEGEKSHCFPIGTKVEVVKFDKALDKGVLYLCTDGNIDQYLWTTEFEVIT